MAEAAIELIGIDKSFGAVRANRDVNLTIERGTIRGIVGENGAGKSTLMSILYGFYHADSGEIRINGVPVAIPDSQAAIRAGIGMVHQHFMLVEPFTVLENVILGAEDGPLLRPSLAKARAELTRLAREYELQVDPDAVVGELSVGFQQRVEILKALYRECDILILDEPTGVLTPAEADHLFRILEHLKAEGKTIVLITHKLREIMAVTDEVSVMRRGEMVRTLETARTSPAELAELMVGRRVLLRVEKAPARPGPAVLEVDGLDVTAASEAQLIELRRDRLGVIYQDFALLPLLTAEENVGLPLRIARVDPKERDAVVAELLERVGLAGHMKQRPDELSGGQQQRVAIARALANRPRVLLADEPTGQLDSETGAAVMELLRQLVNEEGATAIVATHDPSVEAVADAVVHLADGRLAEASPVAQ